MIRDVYARIEKGSNAWQSLQAPDGQLYPWDASSTYIKNPPFFKGMTKVKYRNIRYESTILEIIFKIFRHYLVFNLLKMHMSYYYLAIL